MLPLWFLLPTIPLSIALGAALFWFYDRRRRLTLDEYQKSNVRPWKQQDDKEEKILASDKASLVFFFQLVGGAFIFVLGVRFMDPWIPFIGLFTMLTSPFYLFFSVYLQERR